MIPPLDAYPLEDIHAYPEMNYIADTVRIGENITLDDMALALPLGEALGDGPLSIFHPKFAIGLGGNSTMLNRLMSDGKIKSRSWSMFWGWEGANSDTQMDGSFIFGGYDKAKVRGGGFKQPLRAPDDTCPTGMLVTISDISLKFPNGLQESLFPESRSAAIQACIMPAYPAFMTIPKDPYFNQFINFTGTNVTTSSTGGLNQGTMVYKVADGEVPYRGDLTLSLQSGLQVTLPSHQLLVPERTIQPNTGRVVVDGSLPNLMLNPASRPDLTLLGKMFLSAAYIMVNHDNNEFTLWEANPTTDESIVAIDENGIETSNFCGAVVSGSSSDGSGDSSSGGLPAGAVAGVVIGILAVIGIVAGMVVFLRRRARSASARAKLKTLPPATSGMGHGGVMWLKAELAGGELWGGGRAEMESANHGYFKSVHNKPEFKSTYTAIYEMLMGLEGESPIVPAQHELPG